MTTNPVRVYVAAPWIAKDKAKEARIELEKVGFKVTSSWIDLHDTIEENDPNRAEYLQKQALEDVEDILDADVLILLNLSKSEGKAVETGLALAWRKPVILVGERTNIFHWLPIPQVATLKEAIDLINSWEEVYQRSLEELKKEMEMQAMAGELVSE